MKRFRAIPVILWILAVAFVSGSMVAQGIGERVPNWAVPSTAKGSHGGMTTQADIGFGGNAFVPVDPCRIVKTTGPAGPYGAPSLAAGVPRNFALLGGPCTGLPSAVRAYSLNITVTNTMGPGFIKVYPQGGAVPVVSTLNYNGVLPVGAAIANAAIVPAGTGGGITVVAGVSGTDLLIDINGYFVGNGSLAPLNPNEYVGWQGNNPGPVVLGWNTNSGGYGVWGRSDSHIGVYGTTAASGLGHAGVWGESTDSVGTYGGSINTYGVWAQSTNLDGLAALGGHNGVVGVSTASTDSYYGVLGASGSNGSFAAGVRGQTGSPPAPGFGVFPVPAGVMGSSGDFAYGVLGTSNFIAIQGALIDTNGNQLAGAKLGYQNYGVYSEGDLVTFGVKSFIEPHPEDATKVIRYVCLEGPESGTYFRGRGRFVNGTARIEVPESFRIVSDSDGLTVQITPIGKPTAVAVSVMSLDGIEAEATQDVEFCYIVHGVRKAFKSFEPIAQGSEFRPETKEQKIPAYLTAEAKRRLIANGTYNADGTVNMETAERLGWTMIWAEQAQRAQENAAKAAQEIKRLHPQPPEMTRP